MKKQLLLFEQKSTWTNGQRINRTKKKYIRIVETRTSFQKKKKNNEFASSVN